MIFGLGLFLLLCYVVVFVIGHTMGSVSRPPLGRPSPPMPGRPEWVKSTLERSERPFKQGGCTCPEIPAMRGVHDGGIYPASGCPVHLWSQKRLTGQQEEAEAANKPAAACTCGPSSVSSYCPAHNSYPIGGTS